MVRSAVWAGLGRLLGDPSVPVPDRLSVHERVRRSWDGDSPVAVVGWWLEGLVRRQVVLRRGAGKMVSVGGERAVLIRRREAVEAAVVLGTGVVVVDLRVVLLVLLWVGLVVLPGRRHLVWVVGHVCHRRRGLAVAWMGERQMMELVRMRHKPVAIGSVRRLLGAVLGVVPGLLSLEVCERGGRRGTGRRAGRDGRDLPPVESSHGRDLSRRSARVDETVRVAVCEDSDRMLVASSWQRVVGIGPLRLYELAPPPLWRRRRRVVAVRGSPVCCRRWRRLG